MRLIMSQYLGNFSKHPNKTHPMTTPLNFDYGTCRILIQMFKL